jgi:hypothetical protein
LLIALDAVFFIGSILGTIIAIYILWDKIKQINKTKPGSSKIVPAAKNDEQLKVKSGSAQTSDSPVNNTRIAEASTINVQEITTVKVTSDRKSRSRTKSVATINKQEITTVKATSDGNSRSRSQSQAFHLA